MVSLGDLKASLPLGARRNSCCRLLLLLLSYYEQASKKGGCEGELLFKLLSYLIYMVSYFFRLSFLSLSSLLPVIWEIAKQAS